MCHYEEVKKAEKLINVTESIIETYNKCSGDIVKLTPKVYVLPEKPRNEDLRSGTFFILSEETAEHLRAGGRALDDIAIISRDSFGRDHHTITYFVWGNDPAKEVCLFHHDSR